MKRPWIAAIIVATILILFRLFTASHYEYSNFAPVAALLFCGGVFWKANKWIIPTVAMTWLISWPLVSMIQGYSPFHSSNVVTILSFAIVVAIGFAFAGKSAAKLIFGTLIGASAFYLITNTAAFFSDPLYKKSWEGYVQCMWTGSALSQVPTWMFFRNSLIGNLLGTSLFLATMSIPLIKQSTAFKLADKSAA